MTEFWEKNFREKQEMWGSPPVGSAVTAADMFAKNGFKHILIPGIGYGRNAQVFIDKGMKVTGIEISKTAIDLAEKNHGSSLRIYHGSVADMPFNSNLYDGIFCHALIHLLDEEQRGKLIADCYRQLVKNGLMVFIAITKDAQTYGQGTLISEDRYEQFGGVEMFFYDLETISREFGNYGLVNVDTVVDNFPFHLIVCRR